MKFIVKKSNTKGKVFIPGSKSHTIRALYIASLANGESTIKEPLFSADTQSAINICRAFGAQIRNEQNAIIVQGFNGAPKVPDNILDVGNSGTTLRIGLSTAALIEGISIFTGDEIIELKNVGAQPLNLIGVSFTNGVYFTFTATNAITNLGAASTWCSSPTPRLSGHAIRRSRTSRASTLADSAIRSRTSTCGQGKHAKRDKWSTPRNAETPRARPTTAARRPDTRGGCRVGRRYRERSDPPADLPRRTPLCRPD